ncbi:MAG: 2-oxo acid dehydrogenase subunit E2 [Methanobrevibacter sp.]|jgi:hypothetical protein|nr:2-oxo acid dehydrogenase subunit E2 [Methanobrevibacter sp.]
MNKNNINENNLNDDSNKETRAYKRERQKGERWDGYKVQSIPSFQKLLPYLMKTRDASTNFFEATYDVSEVVKYLDKKNQELKEEREKEKKEEKIEKNDPTNPIKKYNYNQFFIATIVRVFALRPHLNRFVAGKDIYQRHNIEIAYVIKKEFSDEGEESITISAFERDSNLEDVAKILSPAIEGVRTETNDEQGDFIGTLMKFPNFVTSFIVWILDFFIKIGHCPVSLRKMDVMQSSAFISNLGSIGLENVPYHHLYDRGTTSVFLTIGKVRKGFVPTKEGMVEKDLVDMKITMDERITDGFYLVKSLDVLQDILENPQKLDERLKEVPIDE